MLSLGGPLEVLHSYGYALCSALYFLWSVLLLLCYFPYLYSVDVLYECRKEVLPIKSVH